MIDFNFNNVKMYKDFKDECIEALRNTCLEAELYGLTSNLKVKIEKILNTCSLDINNPFIPFLNRTVIMKNLTLGIKLIDAQHKSLFVFIDKFISKLIDNASKSETLKIFIYLEKYSAKHFSDEENLMKESNYPEIEQHINEHKNFKNTVLNIKKQVKLKRYLQDSMNGW